MIKLLRNIAGGGRLIASYKAFAGFTLAEMMVVMLILSIVMAAMAPVVTTRNKRDQSNSSPWKYTGTKNEAYYGTQDNNTALIGQNSFDDTDPLAKLLIKASETKPAHIGFKTGDNVLGVLQFGNTTDNSQSILLGKLGILNATSKPIAKEAVGIGSTVNASGRASTAVGFLSNAEEAYSTAIGAQSKALEFGTAVGKSSVADKQAVSMGVGANAVENSVAVGYNAKTINNSIALGHEAKIEQFSNEEKINNVVIGNSANSTASDSILLGNSSKAISFTKNSSTYHMNDIIAIGHGAEVSQKDSIAIGNNASIKQYVKILEESESNVAIGNNTIIESPYSIAIGSNAQTTGKNAVAIGYKAKGNGDSTVVIGYGANENAEPAAKYNTAVGYETLKENKYGTYNTAFGISTLLHSSAYNTAVGYEAMNATGNSAATGTSDVSSIYNTALGYRSMYKSGNPSYSTAVGVYSLANNGGKHNTAIGYAAMIGSYNNSNKGDYNIAIGAAELKSVASCGSSSVANYLCIDGTLYKAPLANNKNGSHNIAIGTGAMARFVSDNDNNIAIGKNAMQKKTIASNNIAIGEAALSSIPNNEDVPSVSKDQLGERNIAIGDRACNEVQGSNKICIGGQYIVEGHSEPLPSGPNKDSKLANPDDKQQRIYIGSKSLFNGGDAVLEVHNTTETIGDDQNNRYSNVNASGVVINGSLIVKGPILSRPRHAGYHWFDSANAARAGYLRYDGANAEFDIYTGQNDTIKHPLWNTNNDNKSAYPRSSDRRLKYVGKEFTSGLDKIRQLKVFNYTFKRDPQKTPRVGVIAQDLQKVFPDAVKKGNDGFLTIRMEDMFYAVINAIKELDAKVTVLINDVRQLRKENNELKKRIQALEAKVK